MILKDVILIKAKCMEQFDSNRIMDIIEGASNIRNDARKTIIGFLYQFLVALDACFTLHKNQKLYIEKYGDFAILNENNNNSVSAEVKNYKNTLTIRHHNFLNTLYNCFQDSFCYKQYSKLYLITTQQISGRNNLKKWSCMTAIDKYNMLKSDYEAWKTELENRAGCNQKNKKTIEMIDTLLGDVVKQNKVGVSIVKAPIEHNKEKLIGLLERFVIISDSPSFEEKFAEMLDVRAGGIKEERLRKHYLYNLLGYIISPGVVKNDWCITFEDFTAKRQELFNDISVSRRSFPEVKDPSESELINQEDTIYVKKLRDIEFNSEIKKLFKF